MDNPDLRTFHWVCKSKIVIMFMCCSVFGLHELTCSKYVLQYPGSIQSTVFKQILHTSHLQFGHIKDSVSSNVLYLSLSCYMLIDILYYTLVLPVIIIFSNFYNST